MTDQHDNKTKSVAKIRRRPGPLSTADLEGGALEAFAEAMITGDRGQAIVNQERRGQHELAGSKDRIPIAIDKFGPIHDKEAALAKLGIILGPPISGDALFREVTLPPGWKYKPTDHALWSNLVDDKGVERARMFYKAAFYDREAFISFNSRYQIRTDGPDYNDRPAYYRGPYTGRVIDTKHGDKVIFEVGPTMSDDLYIALMTTKSDAARVAIRQEAGEKAVSAAFDGGSGEEKVRRALGAFLNEKYPLKTIDAYWLDE